MAEFVEYKKDDIWEHFLREKTGNSAKYKLCSTILKATGGSTKGLYEHDKAHSQRQHNETEVR